MKIDFPLVFIQKSSMAKIHTFASVYFFLALGIYASTAQGLLMTPGDSYSFEFETLPLEALWPTDPYYRLCYPGYGLNVQFSGLDAGEEYQVDYYSDFLDGDLFKTTTPGGPLPDLMIFIAGGIWDGWSDGQGAVRFTMLSGEAELKGFHVYAFTEAIPGDFEHCPVWGVTVLVPEPKTFCILTIGLGMLYVVSFTRTKGRNRAIGAA